MSPDVKQMLDGLDPAHKQIVFGGFSEKVTQEERVILIEKFLSSGQTLKRRVGQLAPDRTCAS